VRDEPRYRSRSKRVSAGSHSINGSEEDDNGSKLRRGSYVPKGTFAELALKLIFTDARAANKARLGTQVIEREGARGCALRCPLKDAVHPQGSFGRSKADLSGSNPVPQSFCRFYLAEMAICARQKKTADGDQGSERMQALPRRENPLAESEASLLR
jgi:hypothetical protein